LIYDDSKIEIQLRGSRLSVTERDTWKSLLRLFGLLPLSLGVFTLTLLAGVRWFSLDAGLTILALMAFFALGVAPAWSGLDLLFVRRAFVLDTHGERLESHLFLLRWKIWTTGRDLVLFDRIELELQRPGIGGGRRLHVSCAGCSTTVPLASFKNRAAAELFAEEVAGHLQIPVKYDRPRPASVPPSRRADG